MSQARNAVKLIGGQPAAGFLALIAIGGNIPSLVGTPTQTIAAAVQEFEVNGLRITSLSKYYQTPCFPHGAGPDYVNAAVAITSDLDCRAILAALHRIEDQFGRNRVQRWGRRTLDLDFIAMGDRVLPDSVVQDQWRKLPLDEQIENTPEQLILPHPRVQDRGFVLVPLADVAPDWVHPLLNQSVAQMLAALPEAVRTEVKVL